MLMDLKIFESILFGNHRPWIEQNREEEKFEKIMNPKISITARSEEQFFKELYKLLELHPRILAGEPFKIEFPENKPGPIIIDLYAEENEIFEELIDIIKKVVNKNFDDPEELLSVLDKLILHNNNSKSYSLESTEPLIAVLCSRKVLNA